MRPLLRESGCVKVVNFTIGSSWRESLVSRQSGSHLHYSISLAIGMGGRKVLGIFLVLIVCCSTVEIHQEDGVLDLMEEGLTASDQLTQSSILTKSESLEDQDRLLASHGSMTHDAGVQKENLKELVIPLPGSTQQAAETQPVVKEDMPTIGVSTKKEGHSLGAGRGRRGRRGGRRRRGRRGRRGSRRRGRKRRNSSRRGRKRHKRKRCRNRSGRRVHCPRG